MIESIVYNYCNCINDLRKQFTDIYGYGQPNKTFIEWYKKNIQNHTFKELMRKFYALPFEDQVNCLCNLYIIKPLIHEYCIHETLDYDINYGTISIATSWTIQYGDSFTTEELLDCWQNDTLLRGQRNFCYGKWDVQKGLKGWSIDAFRKYILNCISTGKKVELKSNGFDVEKFLTSKDLLYLFESLKPLVSHSVLHSIIGITYSSCSFTEGPFLEMKEDDPLPYDILKRLKTDFTKLPLEERKRIIKENFRVKMYEC